MVGAKGDVDKGVVAATLQGGWQVVATGRNQERLDRRSDRHASACLALVASLEAESAELQQEL